MYKIIWIGFVNYSFTDKQSGKPVSGSTLKAVVAKLSLSGGIVEGISISKVGNCDGGEYPVEKDILYNQLYYDRFGRIIGGQPASKR